MTQPFDALKSVGFVLGVFWGFAALLFALDWRLGAAVTMMVGALPATEGMARFVGLVLRGSLAKALAMSVWFLSLIAIIGTVIYAAIHSG